MEIRSSLLYLKSPSRRSFFTTQATMGDMSNLLTAVPTRKKRKQDVGPTHPVLRKPATHNYSSNRKEKNHLWKVPNIGLIAVVGNSERGNYNFNSNSTVNKAQNVDISCYPLIPAYKTNSLMWEHNWQTSACSLTDCPHICLKHWAGNSWYQ